MLVHQRVQIVPNQVPTPLAAHPNQLQASVTPRPNPPCPLAHAGCTSVTVVTSEALGNMAMNYPE